MTSDSGDSGAAGLAALLAHAEAGVLLVDYDGTLAPIVADPAQAVPAPGAVDALQRLAGHLGVVAILTGRPAGQAVALAGLAERAEELGDLAVGGPYGVERWDARTRRLSSPPPLPGVAVAREALPSLLAELGLTADIEDKGSSLAVHVRRLADPAAALAALREPVARLAQRCGLVVEPGRAVLELRPPGVDKGTALRALVAQAPVPAAAVVMIGDDLGDVAAFEAVAELRSEGLAGVLVCSASGEVDELVRRADIVVQGPQAVVAWLAQLADQLDARRSP